MRFLIPFQFTMVETLTTAVFDQWPGLRNKKAIVVAAMCGVLFLCGLTMVLQGGMYMFELFNFYSAGINILIMAVLEVIIIAYLYGKFHQHCTCRKYFQIFFFSYYLRPQKPYQLFDWISILGFKKYIKHITDDIGIWVPKPLYGYWMVTWCFLTPLSLVVSDIRRCSAFLFLC